MLQADSIRDRAADRLAVAALVLATIAGGFLLRSQSGLAPDSVTYLDMAANVVAGKGLVHRWAYWDPVYETAQLPTPTSMWPPGLSLAIAGLHAAGMNLYVAGRVIGVLAFAVFAVAMYGLARFVVAPRRAFIATMAAVIPTLPWVPVIASELPYLAAASVATLCAAKAALDPDDRANSWWLSASGAAGAAFAFRYVGLASAVQVCLVALLFGRGQKFGTTVRHIALAASVSGLVLGAIFSRNWMVSGTPGQPWAGAHIFWSTLAPSLKAALSIKLGGRELWGSRLMLLAVPAQMLALGSLVVMCGRKIRHAWATSADERDRRAMGATAIVLITLVCTYGVTIAATAANGMDLEDRYLLAPVPWAVMLLVAWGLRVETGVQRRARLAWTAVAVWLFCQSLLTVKVLGLPQDSYVEAAGSSDVMVWLKNHVPADETILSNRGAELGYWLPNPVLRLPRLPHSGHGATSWSDVDRLAHKAGAHYLVHFRQYPEYAKYQQDEFLFLRQLDNSSAFSDREPRIFSEATVYKVGGSTSTN